MTPSFSNAVLLTMKRLGFDEDAITRIVGLTETDLARIERGESKLTDRQLALIEQASGVSAGELAAMQIEPGGGPYTDLASRLAQCMSSPHRLNFGQQKIKA